MTPMTKEEQDRALVENLGLVHMFVRRIILASRIPPHHEDDLLQAGTLGLMKALSRFDKDRDTKISTYAHLWIKVFAWRSIRRLSDRYSVGVDEYDDDCFPAVNAPDHDRMVLLHELKESVGSLPPTLAEVVRGRMDGETLSQIGVRLGLCRERVRQLEVQAHQRLRASVERKARSPQGKNVAAC